MNDSMNNSTDDDLEQQLRDGLRRGSLPAAPDSLRRRLAQLPGEGRPSRFAGLVTGLRMTALASAIAVAVAFVLVVRALPGPGVTGPGSSLTGLLPTASSPTDSSSPLPIPSVGPTASGAATTGPPSAAQSPAPSTEPSTGPSTADTFTCALRTIVPATTSSVVQFTDVRVGTHPGYDRIVFEFAGSGRPQLTVAAAMPPFVGDASGQAIDVAGKSFLTLKLYDASGYPTYSGPDTFSPGYPRLTTLVNNGDFEGYVSWVAGLTGRACYAISTLTSPTRIVIDLQAP
jgi:hypothetical protein